MNRSFFYRIGVIGLVALVVSGCKFSPNAPWARLVDRVTFQWFGGTMVSSPQQLSMKAVHLDQGTAIGRDVIIEGRVLEFGKNETYLIIADESARMLVLLTHLTPTQQSFRDTVPRSVRILGSVERGKKGLPFILARAYSASVPSKLKKSH